MSSVRQQLVDAIVARLGLITTGKVWTLPDGSYTCATVVKGVYPWRKVAISAAQCPSIGIYDTEGRLVDGIIGKNRHDLVVSVVGYLAGTAPIDACRTLAADIMAAIGSDPTWGTLALSTTIESIPLQQDPAGDVVAACQFELSISYDTPLWQL